MKEWFSGLSLEEKRNEFNKDTVALMLLVNKIVSDDNENYFNYVLDNSSNLMSEDDFLTEEYAQIEEIKNKIINIFK